VQSDLVTERAHNVVAICPETNDDTGTTECEDPERHGDLGANLRSRPDKVDGSIRTDGVGNVVGTVSKGSSRCSKHLEERVGVLGAVVVVLPSCMNLFDVAGQEVPVLLLVDDVLLDTVESGVLDPVPSDGGSVPQTRGRALLGLRELAIGFGDVCWCDRGERSDVGLATVAPGVDGAGGALLNVISSNMRLSSALGFELFGGQVAGVEVANTRETLGPGCGLWATEQKGSLDDFPALELPVFDDDLTVQERDEESSNDDGNTASDTEGDTYRLLVGELDLG
jgi:hypothetical protein